MYFEYFLKVFSHNSHINIILKNIWISLILNTNNTRRINIFQKYSIFRGEYKLQWLTEDFFHMYIIYMLLIRIWTI